MEFNFIANAVQQHQNDDENGKEDKEDSTNRLSFAMHVRDESIVHFCDYQAGGHKFVSLIPLPAHSL